MALQSGSVRLALCAMLTGTASAWALSPHDRVRGPRDQQLVNQHAETAQNEGVPGADERGTADRPLIIKTIAPEKSPQEAAQDRKDRKNKRWYDHFSVVIGVITVCGIFLQTIIFGLQAIIFNRQARSLRDTISAMERVGTKQSDDMRDSIKIAKDGATAALTSAGVATRTADSIESAAEKQLRAYVGIENGYLACEVFEDQIRAKPVLRIKNVGQTPAYEVTSSIGFATAKSFSDQIDATQTLIEGKTYIFPNGHHRIIGAGATLEVPSKIGVEVYVFGRIEYRDIFAAKRSTRFRFVVRNLDSPDRKGELAPCNDGNDAT